MSIIAHSNGGLIAAYYKLTHNNCVNLKHIILCAPFLGINQQRMPFKIMELFLTCICFFYKYLDIPKPLNVTILTHDKSKQLFFKQDVFRLKICSVRWFLEARRAQKIVQNNSGLWVDSKLFLILAGDDLVVDNTCSMRFFSQLSLHDKLLKSYTGLYHQILNEINFQDIYGDIYSFLNKD